MDIKTFKKKILYKATYRGTRENDFLIKNFVVNFIENLENKERLLKLENFLDLPDQIIFKVLKEKNCEIYYQFQEIFDELSAILAPSSKYKLY